MMGFPNKPMGKLLLKMIIFGVEIGGTPSFGNLQMVGPKKKVSRLPTPSIVRCQRTVSFREDMATETRPFAPQKGKFMDSNGS